MNSAPAVKRQLHSSHLSMLYRCGEQFKRVVLDGDLEPPGFAAVVGRSAHQVAQDNLTRKLATGALMTLEEVRDLARDSFQRSWESTPVFLNKEERESGFDKVKGLGIDRTIAISEAHARFVAPIITPREGGIERKWVVKANGYPFDLAGQIDVEEADHTIRDFKTGFKLVSQRFADTSEQLTIYSWAKNIIDKVAPPRVVLDGVAVSKTGQVTVESFESKRTQADFDVARRRFDRAVEVIEKGAFTPANPTDWWCSEKFCGFAADGSCPFFNKSRPLSISVRKKGERHDRKQPKAVAARTDEWWGAVR